jgi:hypothetical protein
MLAHPDAPRDWSGFLVADWMPCQLECQLDLTMMVTLVPDHVLEVASRGGLEVHGR